VIVKSFSCVYVSLTVTYARMLLLVLTESNMLYIVMDFCDGGI